MFGRENATITVKVPDLVIDYQDELIDEIESTVSEYIIVEREEVAFIPRFFAELDLVTSPVSYEPIEHISQSELDLILSNIRKKQNFISIKGAFLLHHEMKIITLIIEQIVRYYLLLSHNPFPNGTLPTIRKK